MSKYKFCLLSIATDRYLEYWQSMIKSAGLHVDLQSLQVLLFTDKPEDISSEIHELLKGSLVTRKISHEPWPMPTLKRFEYIVDNSEAIEAANVLYVDADMLVQDDINFDYLLEILEQNELAFVEHPGYFRPNGIEFYSFYIRNPVRLLKDLVLRFRKGALGSWETNKDSSAYVERKNRKVYFCGGLWLGTTDAILQMAQQLSNEINKDLKGNKVAIFHDESHLNRYAIDKNPAKLSPRYCFDPTYAQLKSLSPIVVAVDKHQGTPWLR